MVKLIDVTYPDGSLSNLSKMYKELLFALFIMAVVLVFQPNKASAATINVDAGNAAINSGDSVCNLEEAAENINNSANTFTDCTATGAYGTNDTINLPSGTINGGSGSGIGISFSKATKVLGQGRDESILDNVGLNIWGSGFPGTDFTLQDFKTNSQISASSANKVTIQNIEITEDFGVGSGVGIVIRNIINATISDSYIHDADIYYDAALSLEGCGSGFTGTYNINNTTISNVEGMGIFTTLGSDGGILNVNISNTTIDKVSNVAIANLAEEGDLNITYTNNTIGEVLSESGSGSGSGLDIHYGILDVINDDGTASINHTFQNNIFASGDGNDVTNYQQMSGSGLLPVPGNNSPYISVTSLGGNVSSDASFASKLTNTKDKNNVTNLASFLGVLSSNGGSVPTLALKSGSPAIDAGTVAGSVTTDARGLARPQGGAYDAGAYELPSAFTINPDSDTIGLTGVPVISSTPTFSGSAIPGSTVVVEVHSDVVTCSATATSNGSWSCTLPSSLPAGTHTVNILITYPDGSTTELGPYQVLVAADEATTITSDNLANTGANTKLTTLIAGILALSSGATTLIRRKLKYKLKTGYKD